MKVRWLAVMGVSGSGKTTVGKVLASRLGWDFYDADEFHPSANIAKMVSRIPLNDEDRTPWLAALHDLIADELAANRPGVLACSALKQKYRDILSGNSQAVLFIYLKGSYELIWSRMAARPGHYMHPSMLRSQFEALEEPAGALVVDITQPADVLVEHILSSLTGLSE